MAGYEADLPRSWACPRVAEVGAVRLGRQRSPAHASGRFSTPYLRAGNITEHGLDLSDVFEMDFTPAEQATYALRAADVLVAEASGSPKHVGRPAIWEEELPLCCFQNTVIRFRAHVALPRYALAVFQHFVASGAFRRAARGIGLLHLSGRRFGDMRFPLPPLAEQHRIVAVLEAKVRDLYEGRAALRSALAGTHEQDREILLAAATGRLRQPGLEAASPESAHGDASGSPVKVPATDHAIPAGWSWAPVESVGELTLGKTMAAGSSRGPSLRPYLRVANVLEDRIDFSDVKEMSFSDAEAEKYGLHAGDILLNEGQSPELVGRPAMYGGELPQLYFQNSLLRFRAGATLDPHYALLVFRHYLHAGEFRRISRGSTNIAHLSRARLAAMPVPVPPLDEQRQIVAEARRRLAASREQRLAIQSSLDQAEDMAGELLSAAVTGRLVAQDPADEPASQLLDRLGLPPSDRGPATVPRMSSTTKSTASGRAVPTTAPVAGSRDLTDVLAEAGRPLTLLELCRAADVDLNDVDRIEHFYTTLRAEVGRSIRIVGNGGEDAELEVIPSAPG
jgi:Type I restriction modification DNA specificity domain